MKLAILSDNPNISSGYGKMARYLGFELHKIGHEIVYFGLQAKGGESQIIWPDGTLATMYSASPTRGQDTIDRAISLSKPDMILTIRDAVTLDTSRYPQGYSFAKYKGDIKSVLYTPIMALTLPDSTRNAMIASSDFIVTFTEHAKNFLTMEGVPYNMVDYVNVGFDPQIMKRTEPSIKPPKDAPLFGFIGLAQDTRKRYMRLLQAFKFYLDHYDSDAFLYTHNSYDALPYELATLIPKMNLRGHMLFPNTTPERKWIAEWGVSEEYMAGLYSSFNATVSASGMEGFNVPFLESLACETPAVGIAQPSYDWSDQIIQARSNAWDEIIPFSYVFESSPEAFAVCMDKALKYKVDREKLMHLTWNSVAKKFNSIIVKV